MRNTFGPLVLLVAGCGVATPPTATRTATEAPVPDGTKRVLSLGDSYTIGEGVAETERWPVQLVAALKKDGRAVADPTILATTGWTTADLTNALDRQPPKGPYDLVTLLIGVNNQYQGKSIEEYRKDYAALVKRAIALAGGKADRVVVVSIPDWGVTPYAKDRNVNVARTSRAIDDFNAVKKAETEAAGVAYVEITVASRRAATEPDLLAKDGLHPSGKMYAEWVAAVLPHAKKVLK